MPLGTLDRTPPPFFKQGPSALSKLMVFSAVALFLMVADLRFRITAPVRGAVATVLYPLQWLVMQPVQAAGQMGGYFTSLHQAQQDEAEARKKLAAQAERSLQLEQLALENQRLRELLVMRERITTPTTGAQVLYDAADPYTRRVVIDRGQTHGVKAGAPVIVALTGWGQADDKRKAQEAGFDHHFTKPVDPAELQSKIDALN